MINTKEQLNGPDDTASDPPDTDKSKKPTISSESTNSKTIERLNPTVCWAQSEKQIFLKVELRDSTTPVVDFTHNSLAFYSKGYGARGLNEYKFQLRFYDIINDEESSYRVYDSKIEFVIKKHENAWWPRLIATPQKPHWLRIDFNRWTYEDDMLDEAPRDVMQDYSREYEKLQKEELGFVIENAKNVYLIFYNFAQFIGYLYIICVLSILYIRDGSASIVKAHENVGKAMEFCQLIQYLEVMHPMFGYTRGSPLIPFLQITGRNFILFIMIELEERMHTKPVVFYIFCIWALIEVVRYPYYISQLLKKNIGFLTWLRYSLWIPLYPMGIICEGIIVLRNIPYIEESQRWSISMPNTWNATFHMATFLKIYLLLLTLPGSYFMMSHMARMRAKKLGTGKRMRKYVD